MNATLRAPRRRRRSAGFTLLEVMAALSIFLVGVVSLLLKFLK